MASLNRFEVYLRLRPDPASPEEHHPSTWLHVDQADPTHIELRPPNDSRKRATERFSFTRVFKPDSSQLQVFEETGSIDLVQTLLSENRDGLVATLGVSGSGKSHTILGSKTQRGLTQMTLDVLFRSLGQNLRCPGHTNFPTDAELLLSLQGSDASEAQISAAGPYLESLYGDGDRARQSRAQTPMVGGVSRAQTPMTVWHPEHEIPGSFPASPPQESSLSQRLPQCTSQASNPFPSSVSDQSGPVTPTLHILPTIPEMSPKKGVVMPSKMPFWNRSSNVRRTFAKFKASKESLCASFLPRRHLPARPSALPQIPDVSSHATEVDHNADYVVLLSMYEVYNDRIFDLLPPSTQTNVNQTSTRQGAALQKDLRRRPLLFKYTEMSPDRKVVAGLRKIACGSYEDAMMILETGLTERRVAGTGLNSVSSRSHGFFCIEVKRRSTLRHHGTTHWTGASLSVVDLAGSERARSAKTTGSTLAEAGKINESLMYLGQCLQVQSDCQQDGSKPVIPFRQCKLTELLFSNSFPSSSAPHHVSTFRTPQKAIIIVTADPQGDFNATSQILRYSALAREVTVPRIPSVTSTILNGAHSLKHAAPPIGGKSTTHMQFSEEELEQASSEIARLSEECDQMAVKLAQEEIQRTEADLKLQAAEEKALLMEQEVREECWAEMEATMEEERRRWKKARDEERGRAEEYLDGKIEIVEKGVTIDIYPDATASGRTEELERENDLLRVRLEALERELQQRSPTKKSKHKAARTLKENANTNPATNPFLASLKDNPTADKIPATPEKLEAQPPALPERSPLRETPLVNGSTSVVGTAQSLPAPRKVSVPKTPGTVKKQRKLTTRKWDLGQEEGSDLESYY